MRIVAESVLFQETNAMYEALVGQIPAVVYVDADDESSTALYMSPQVEQALGYTQEEWLTDPDLWVKLLHPEDREHVLAEANRTRTTGDAFDAEYRLLAHDGRILWVHDKAVRVEVESSVVWQGVLLDITKRKRAEEELRRSEELFKKTFELAGVGMAHVALDGRWLRVNDDLCKISGYSHTELLEKTFLELTPPEDRKASLNRVRRMLAGELGSYSLDRRYARKDGSQVWVSLSVSLVRNLSGEPDFLICVAEDITERKINELVPDSLTCREMEVLRQIVAGRTNPQITRCLTHSLGTIKLDVRHVLHKLGVKNRKEAVTRAVEIGLVTHHKR